MRNWLNDNNIIKVDIPLFYGSLGVDKFLEQQVDEFFNLIEVPENMLVKMVVVCLKGVAS